MRAADTSDPDAARPRLRWSTAGKVAALLAAVVVVAGFTLRRPGGADLPNAPEDAVTYICSTDRHVFSLTPRQLDQARDELGPGTHGSAPCPKCRQHSGRRAEMVNGKPILPLDGGPVDGSVGALQPGRGS